MIDLSKLKVGKNVKSDDGDHLYPPVALFYEYDPDDPTPLFGDASPQAVDAERMLLDLMTVRGSNAGSIHAYINDMRCAEYRSMERKELELKRSKARTKRERSGRFAAVAELDASNVKLEESEATRHKGSDGATLKRVTLAEEWWYGHKTELLKLKAESTSYVEIFRGRVKSSGTWPARNPQIGYCPDATVIRKWVKKFLEEDSS